MIYDIYDMIYDMMWYIRLWYDWYDIYDMIWYDIWYDYNIIYDKIMIMIYDMIMIW